MSKAQPKKIINRSEAELRQELKDKDLKERQAGFMQDVIAAQEMWHIQLDTRVVPQIVMLDAKRDEPVTEPTNETTEESGETEG